MPTKKLIKKANKPSLVTKKIHKKNTISSKKTKITVINRKREPLRRTKTMEESVEEGEKYIKAIQKIH